ncbi:hypothetical protein [Niabella ginsenosidivorans]|uniref:hypothetical protein n=1 Tax=Niabella ginsenosidivorans TaxID=1176587 RepID=UPI0012EEDE6B|nr:hypothetical protein [Niabella ginsenosidivorans]
MKNNLRRVQWKVIRLKLLKDFSSTDPCCNIDPVNSGIVLYYIPILKGVRHTYKSQRIYKDFTTIRNAFADQKVTLYIDQNDLNKYVFEIED